MGKSLSASIASARAIERGHVDERHRAMTPYALSVCDYAGEGLRTLNEMDRLASAIDYLRFVDGEKHLIYIAERGMYLPRVEADLSIAASANQARVT